MTTKPNIGINEPSRKQIAEGLAKLLADPSHDVRDAACWYARDRAVSGAVPALLALLGNPDSSKSATEALTRIRFIHEQQSYWERITKGLDASPASAAEKLLLQAKPGEPKDQRLLAIMSLGTLGAPEALPFLIDWVKDADADVQKAAKDAITQIHLHPRK